MASQSIQIPDMWLALQSSAMPGKFSEDGKRYEFPVIKTVDTRGNTRNWYQYVELISPSGGAVAFNKRPILAQPVPQLDGYRGKIMTETWHDGGQRHGGKTPTWISTGRNLGKKNATNCATQALRTALGTYNKHLKAAGRKTSAIPAPSLRPLPMLVKKIGDTVDATLSLQHFRRPEAGVTLQRKLNGLRLVAREDGRAENGIEFYSRSGGEYPGMPHLRAQLAILFAKAPAAWQKLCEEKGLDPWSKVKEALADQPDDNLTLSPEKCADRQTPVVYLDGEVYKHGKSLRWISGQARSGTGGGDLEYWIFDCFFPTMHAVVPISSATRQRMLTLMFELALENPGKEAIPDLHRVENFPICGTGSPGAVSSETLSSETLSLSTCMDQVERLARQFLKEGYEGAIARKDRATYQYGTNGYHSSHLVKIKPIHDSEFEVVGYTQGERGKEVGAVIWICEVPAKDSPTGKAEEFSVVPKNMTYEERYKIHRCLDERDESGVTRFERDFLRKPLTVEYPELSSKTGKPTQAKALMFRTYEPAAGSEVPEDPVTKLLRECQ